LSLVLAHRPKDTGVRLRKIWLAIMIAERGSFSDAAAAMGISQSAASRAIESLEIEFQCALFERRGHSVKATRQGEILLFRAKRAREQLRRAASEFGETRAEAVFDDMMRASDHEYRAFIAVYNQTTVSQAASSLGIKQPSISRSLSRLELRLKQVLFERRSFELSATQMGRKLVVPFKLMFRELDQAREEIKLNLGKRKGQVVLGCLPPTRTRLVPDAILALISEYPDVNARVVDGIFPALFAMLMHGEMDLLVGTLRDPLPEGTNAEFLLYDRVSIVVRPEHPLARQDVVTLEACLQYDWILPNSSAPLRQFFNKFLQSHGFNSPERYTEVDSIIVGRSLLCNSDRIAILSYFHVEQEVRWGRLSTLPLPLPDAGRKFGILTKEDYLPTPFVAAFIEALRTVAKQLQQDVIADAR
jgi:LysR family transcriptional regulator, regulator for genes of the gallate degradation pathway